MYLHAKKHFICNCYPQRGNNGDFNWLVFTARCCAQCGYATNRRQFVLVGFNWGARPKEVWFLGDSQPPPHQLRGLGCSKIGIQQRSFERYHPRPHTVSFSPRSWFVAPPKTSIAIISGTGKATDFKFGRYIHRRHPNKSPLKFWRKGSVGVFGDSPTFSGTGKAISYGLKIWPGPSEQKPTKELGEKGA